MEQKKGANRSAVDDATALDEHHFAPPSALATREFAKLVGRQPFGLAAGESGSTRQLVVNLVTRPKFAMVSRQKIE